MKFSVGPCGEVCRYASCECPIQSCLGRRSSQRRLVLAGGWLYYRREARVSTAGVSGLESLL